MAVATHTSDGSTAFMARRSCADSHRAGTITPTACPRACTPASVRPDPRADTGAPQSRSSASSITPCTVRWAGCLCQPLNPAPSYWTTSCTVRSAIGEKDSWRVAEWDSHKHSLPTIPPSHSPTIVCLVSITPPPIIPGVIKRLIAGESIPAAELTAAFDLVMSGEATPVQISALLVGLRVKGETAEEVAAVAKALRNAMVSLAASDPDALVDTCGTGGGAVTTFNISTAAALVAAGAGVRIAKHGNRSFTSQCGSADVLEALDVRIEMSVASMEKTLRDAGIVFMFAPLMHPAMKHVGPVRRELGVPTGMNMVGPLANPARAGRQVMGVADATRVPLMAGALRELGATH